MNSIRRQLTRHLLTATLVLLGGGLLAIYLLAREMVLEQFDAALRAKALAISTLTRAGPEGVNVAFTDRFLRGFDDDKARDFFQLWDERGRTIARSESLKNRELPGRAGKPDKPERWNLTLPTGRPGRAIGFRFKPRDGETEVKLVVASDAEDLHETLWGLLGLSAGCGALLMLVTLWLIPRVLRRGLRPLDELGAQAAAIDADSLGTRFAADRLPIELRSIAERLNLLLARLERSFERERRFSADLAHELRTPLAELRSLAECALKWPETRDAATDHETLAIARQMERLVTQMLALTRGDQGELAVACEAIPVDELVRNVWRGFAVRAGERGLAVQLALAPAIALADAALLRAVVANLCDNAVDHAPAGSEITLKVASDGERVRVDVSNLAPELTPADLERMFDRFWRKEAARTGGLHVGLGLSLARSFAEAMGWALNARLEENQRIVFALSGVAAKGKNGR